MADLLEIPIDTSSGEVSAFDLRTILDGIAVRLDFDWSEREGRWYLSIETDGGTVLCRHRKCLPGDFPLNRTKYREDCPQGHLFWYGRIPDRTTLGKDLRLIYTEAGLI